MWKIACQKKETLGTDSERDEHFKATIKKKRSKHCRLLRPCSLYLCREKTENIIV